MDDRRTQDIHPSASRAVGDVYVASTTVVVTVPTSSVGEPTSATTLRVPSDPHHAVPRDGGRTLCGAELSGLEPFPAQDFTTVPVGRRCRDCHDAVVTSTDDA